MYSFFYLTKSLPSSYQCDSNFLLHVVGDALAEGHLNFKRSVISPYSSISMNKSFNQNVTEFPF